MNRKEFIATCGVTCLSALGFSSLLAGCSGTKTLTAVPSESQTIQLSKKEFILEKKDRTKYLESVMIRSASLDFPIVVYRFSNESYKALQLKCTHQHAELTVNGNILSCSAHGSEFNNKGVVTQGPAEENLKEYPISITTDNLIIHLT